MNFTGKRAVYDFVNQFYYYLLIIYIKTLAIVKRWQFEDKKSNKIESSISKRYRLDLKGSNKKHGLHKYEDESECEKYVFFLFFSLFFFQK